MFTQEFLKEIDIAFEEQIQRLPNWKEEIQKTLEMCTDSEREALKCLYASMPISDGADYSPQIFLSYAKHGVYLWEKGPFARKIPEEIFVGYVLHHRVNNEDITDHRKFFFEQLIEKIQGKSMKEAILFINYWCAAQVTYRTTDGRTASAYSLYKSAYGRCGEESTFTVSVLRSLGIPARQVYVPLWSHCDDNHAWVEVWCDGEWKFLGACEPEEVLNKGWFTNASSRAMMVHSRWLIPVMPKDDIVGKRGMSQVLNQLQRYAHTVHLETTVLSETGERVPNAILHFEVLNYASFGEIATVKSGNDGKRTLETGLGTLHITAYKDGLYGETLVDTRNEHTCTIILSDTGEECDVWQSMVFFAPKDAPINRCIQTEEELKTGKEKLALSVQKRQEKENKFFDEALAEKALKGFSEEDKKRLLKIMKLAKGNQKEIADFLMTSTDGKWSNSWKIDILESLREKDYVDITAEILQEHCEETAPFAETYEQEILKDYILCPRVDNEMICRFRKFILTYLTEEEKKAIRENPKLVWKMMQERLITDENLEYGNLITSAKGALQTGYGSPLTKRVVSVQILRTLGIPSRLNPADHILEIWKDGCFLPLEQKENQTAQRTASIILKNQEDMVWTYFQNWSIAKFVGNEYQTLQLCDESGEKLQGEIPLFSGKYRILTTNRMPNGNIFAKKMVFELSDKEKREITLELMEAHLSDMLEDNDITDFVLHKEDGTQCYISELVKDKKGLFIWLEENQEPTEHILNEIYQRREVFGTLSANIYFVLRDATVKENETVKRTLANVPNIQILFDDFGSDMAILARRMYLEPDKLPLIVIVDETLTGIYGIAGYNVGTADMVVKLLNMKNKQ